MPVAESMQRIQQLEWAGDVVSAGIVSGGPRVVERRK